MTKYFFYCFCNTKIQILSEISEVKFPYASAKIEIKIPKQITFTENICFRSLFFFSSRLFLSLSLDVIAKNKCLFALPFSLVCSLSTSTPTSTYYVSTTIRFHS